MVEEQKQKRATRLTEKRLARAIAQRVSVILYDPSTKGFAAKVSAGGGVSFFVRYGPGARRRYLSLGRRNEEFDIEDARKLAVKALGAVADGKDPVQERQKERAQATLFGAWVQTYLLRSKRLRKEKKEPARHLAVAAKKWARRGLDTITRTDVLNFRDELVEEAAKRVKARRVKRARVNGEKVEHEGHELDGHVTANRFLAHLAAAFAAAREEGLITTNPAAKIPMLPEAPPRARVLSDEEMGRLLEALETEDAFTATTFHVLIETGCRVSEILRSRWADFDLENGAWRIPSTKAGRPQAVALAAVTVERLKKLKKLGVSDFVIPARSDSEKARFDVRQDWLRLKEKAKLGDARIHDLRRSFGVAVARGAGLAMAAKLLRNDIRVASRVYTPLGIDLQREAVENRARLLTFPKKAKAK